MSDLTNLIYNADFSKSKDGWSNSATVENGVITITGDLYNNYYIPINPDDTYRLSFDMKLNTTGSNKYFYIRLNPYDSNKDYISITAVNRVPGNSTTTLAAPVKNGDTTITVTSAANFYNDSVSYYKYIGICDNIAWGYNRCTRYAKYTSISGNVITLASAWSAGSYAAGTKVACFRDGGTNYYPWYDQVANMPSGWFHKSVTFKGSNIRFSTQYVTFATYGYDHNYSLRNIKLENISNLQLNPENADSTTNLEKDGVVHCSSSGELGRNIRYIKDTTSGSSANTANHWAEIKALNEIGTNVAYNKKSKIGSGEYGFHYCTDGNTASRPYDDGGGGTISCIVDLGFVTKISELKIWHYWADGRTYYNHTVSVSEDGTNWDIVYQGKHPETEEGFSIILEPSINSIYKTGFLESNKYVEY